MTSWELKESLLWFGIVEDAHDGFSFSDRVLYLSLAKVVNPKQIFSTKMLTISPKVQLG